MNRDEILKLADGLCNISYDHSLEFDEDSLITFANKLLQAGAAAEREECAKVCDKLRKVAVNDYIDRFSDNHDCAAAIRQRGEK